MSVSIDQTFVKQFEADVHLAYQQMGTKLRSTVRTKSNVVGQSTTFQKVGRGTASTKSRHGIVPVMNLNHTPVECTLQDYYAGDWVDAMNTATTSVGDYSTGLTKTLILSAVEKLNEKDVPDDGRRFAVIGVKQWNELLGISEFSSADYVGDNAPYINGFETRKWFGIAYGCTYT